MPWINPRGILHKNTFFLNRNYRRQSQQHMQGEIYRYKLLVMAWCLQVSSDLIYIYMIFVFIGIRVTSYMDSNVKCYLRITFQTCDPQFRWDRCTSVQLGKHRMHPVLTFKAMHTVSLCLCLSLLYLLCVWSLMYECYNTNINVKAPSLCIILKMFCENALEFLCSAVVLLEYIFSDRETAMLMMTSVNSVRIRCF